MRAHPREGRGLRRPDLSKQPILVFWEVTKACLLECKHCRAEAITKPLPGELNTSEALSLIEQVAEFDSPKPILVLTGGDPLMRKDLWSLISHATSKGLRVALAPSVTDLLTSSAIKRAVDSGVKGVSISIDGARDTTHDSIRGIRGTWARTLEVVREFVETGIHVQINTTIMRDTVLELADMVRLLHELGVEVWEPFYLVPTGRASMQLDLSPQEWEDVSSFLYEASKYGLTVRTVEGPMFRRVSITRLALEERGIKPDRVLRTGRLYQKLVAKLRSMLGNPWSDVGAQTTGTRDGKGVIFVAHDGTVQPSGFLPVGVGNVKEKGLVEIYRDSSVLKRLRSTRFEGKCGKCEFREVCGGSRARAYSYTRNMFAEDPACHYTPGSLEHIAERAGLRVDDFLESLNKLSGGRIM